MENGPPKWLPDGGTLFRGFGGLSLANWGDIGQKLKRPISLFDQMRRRRVLTNWCWYALTQVCGTVFSWWTRRLLKNIPKQSYYNHLIIDKLFTRYVNIEWKWQIIRSQFWLRSYFLGIFLIKIQEDSTIWSIGVPFVYNKTKIEKGLKLNTNLSRIYNVVILLVRQVF